ncbi:MAG: rhodanese-like domain-containing protein [Candidatus Eisenbacteria bacterium]|nr:rhodanese-like domain-containing protein [Candidatus Eisenbacteria bacterium]
MAHRDWKLLLAFAAGACVMAGCGPRSPEGGVAPGSQSAAVSPSAPGTFDDISPGQARDYLSKGAFLLDVRFPYEWMDDLGHLEGAKQIPVTDLETRLKDLEPYRDKDVVVYCRSGVRSRAAADVLARSGFAHVHNLRGGLEAYRDWQKGRR